MKRLLLTIIFALLVTTQVAPLVVFAQQSSEYKPVLPKDREYTLLEPIPCFGTSDGCEDGVVKKVNFKRYLNLLFVATFSIAAIAAVFMITLGGFQYMTTDIPDGKSEGKTRIWNAIQGLVMVLISYIILYTIDPNLVRIKDTLVPELGIRRSDFAELLTANELALRAAQLRSARRSADDLDKLADEAFAIANDPSYKHDEDAYWQYIDQGRKLRKEAEALRLQTNAEIEMKKALANIESAKVNGGIWTSSTNFNSEDQGYYENNYKRVAAIYEASIKRFEEMGDKQSADLARDNKVKDLTIIEEQALIRKAVEVYKASPTENNWLTLQQAEFKIKDSIRDNSALIKNTQVKEQYTKDANIRYTNLSTYIKQQKEVRKKK